MNKMKLKRGDQVIVISGKDKDKQGKILIVDRKNSRVIVEGVNMRKKHQKPSAAHQQGGILEIEAPINASKVMYMHNGKRTRIGYQIENGKKFRIAKSTGKAID